QRCPVMGEAPALAGIGEGPDLLEIVALPDDAERVPPGEADDSVPPERAALAEHIGPHRPAAQQLAVLEAHHPQLGPADLPGALVDQLAIDEETLGEGSGVVRQGADDLPSDPRMGGPGAEDDDQQRD